MKTIVAIIAVAVIAAGLYFMVDVDVTQEARLPNVNVDVEGGQLPKAEVKTGEINLTEEKVTVKVPEVNVDVVEKDVVVPGLEVKTPEETTSTN